MNRHLQSEQLSFALVEIIDLKWLLAHEGHQVHVERLLAEPAYADECLALAEGSPSQAVRSAAGRLRRKLWTGPPV